MSQRRYMSAEDPEAAYKKQRIRIRMQLPSMTGPQIQDRIGQLDEEITALRKENIQFENAVEEIRRTGKASINELGLCRTLTSPGEFELRLIHNRSALKWIQREKRIYQREAAKRRIQAVQLPVIRANLALKRRSAHAQLAQMRSLSEKQNQLYNEYMRTTTEKRINFFDQE